MSFPPWLPFTNHADIVSAIGSTVELEMFDKTIIRGFLYSIDPETFNVFLVTVPTSKPIHTICAFSNAIAAMKKIGEPHCPVDLSCDDISLLWRAAYNPDTKTARLKSLVAALKQQNISYKEVGESLDIMEGTIRIDPPYTISSCFTSSPIVLEQMKSLLPLNPD